MWRSRIERARSGRRKASIAQRATARMANCGAGGRRELLALPAGPHAERKLQSA